MSCDQVSIANFRNNMPPTKVVLLACGSFNPPTHMHLRMFEIARDHLHRLGNYVVVGGLVSPVHDAYGKKDLVPSYHRTAMLKLALQNNDWIRLSDWECKQESWSRTRNTLQHHQNLINSVANNGNMDDLNEEIDTWIPENIKNGFIGPVQVKLLCGGDLLESFGTPGLWSEDDIDTIVGQHGIVVITREGSNPSRFIYESDLLTRYMGNIHLVTEWITNEVSSTKIRRALKRCESVKYLLSDSVIDYIYRHELYGCKNNKYLKLTDNIMNLLTPSPTDVIMESPSPTDNQCMSICNNNLFVKNSSSKQSLDVDALDATNKAKQFRHPGQAVKILTDNNGDHQVIRNQVCNYPTPQEFGILKSSKSCTHFDESKVEFKSSRSNSEICGYQDCDENMIKFIFTKHGIQVISDIETVV